MPEHLSDLTRPWNSIRHRFFSLIDTLFRTHISLTTDFEPTLTYGYGFEGLRQKTHWDDLTFGASYPPTSWQSRYSLGARKIEPLDSELAAFFQKFSKIVFIHFGSTAEVDSRDIKVIIDAVRKAEDIAFIIEESDSEYAVLRQMDNVLLRKGLPLREVMANENVKLRLMCGEPSDLMETLYYGTSVLIFA